MKTYQITLPDDVSEETVTVLLATLGITLEHEQEAIVKGTFLPHEKPSDFVPIWDKDERTFEQIRENAWKRK